MQGEDVKAKANMPPVKLQKVKFKWKDLKGDDAEVIKPEKFRPKAIDKSVTSVSTGF